MKINFLRTPHQHFTYHNSYPLHEKQSPIQQKMRFLRLLQASLFAITILASSSDTSTARFNKYLTKSISAAGSLKLDDTTFEDLTKSPRDYYVATLLTAMPAQFGCVLCKAFQPEFDILAKSWTNGDRKGSSKMLFGTLDFPDGRGTFQKVGSYSIAKGDEKG